jgi:pilus assembly protein CpaE
VNDVSLRPARATASPSAPPAAFAFARDRDSESVIRQCFHDLGLVNGVIMSGDVQAAIAELSRRPSPRLLIVDIGDIQDPVDSLKHLADVCDPSTGVLVIGDRNDISLYRQLKDAGIVEYFFKPLVAQLVLRACNGVLTGNSESRGASTGRLTFMLGVRGGVGATTIAVNAAWNLAEGRRRRALLLDLDLLGGDAALQLDTAPTHALREALEHPERVDELYLERAVARVSDRLTLLASLEPLTEPVAPSEDSVLSLMEKLQQRYRYVFVDMPVASAPWLPRVLDLPGTIILVSDGSLSSARDLNRWREKLGPNSPQRTTMHILNRAGAEGSLPQAEFVRAVGQAPDIVVPYDSDVARAAHLGIRALEKSTTVRRALAPLFQHLAGDAVVERRSLLSRLFK